MTDKDKIAALMDSLVLIISLEDRKEAYGEDLYYKQRMPIAMDKARRAIQLIQDEQWKK